MVPEGCVVGKWHLLDGLIDSQLSIGGYESQPKSGRTRIYVYEILVLSLLNFAIA